MFNFFLANCQCILNLNLSLTQEILIFSNKHYCGIMLKNQMCQVPSVNDALAKVESKSVWFESIICKVRQNISVSV